MENDEIIKKYASYIEDADGCEFRVIAINDADNFLDEIRSQTAKEIFKELKDKRIISRISNEIKDIEKKYGV